jgi:hypothetical protein
MGTIRNTTGTPEEAMERDPTILDREDAGLPPHPAVPRTWPVGGVDLEVDVWHVARVARPSTATVAQVLAASVR